MSKECTNLVSSVVCARWLYVTEPWPSRAKDAKIEPSRTPDEFLLNAASTASAPKHLIVWAFRFEVAARSCES